MENWKDIKGYEGLYQVSDLGRIKSLAREIMRGNGFKYTVKEKIRKPSIRIDGYLAVNLLRDGIRESKNIHVLVAMAFLNHKPNGMKIVVDHITNDRSDNRLENLQLISQRENCTKDKKGYSSQHVGVGWNKASNKWRAAIKIDGKRNHLGYFSDELEAAKAYQSKLREITNERI